jgi:hypothetical protein
LQFAQANAQTKNCKRAFTFATQGKIIFKISPSKNFKTATAQPTKKQLDNYSKINVRQELYNLDRQKASL